MSLLSFDFRVVSREKKEKPEGTKYVVKLKCADGHTINLVSTNPDIFAGFPFFGTIPVKIGRVRTLPEAAGLESA